MTQYNVYLSGDQRVIDADSSDTLASLRQKLGDDAANYDFVYYNTFTRKKTILTDRSVEREQNIGSAMFPDNTIIMAATHGVKTDLFGTRAEWLKDRHMGIQVTLNNNDEVARQQNAGKFQPIMLTDVQPSNSSSNVFYQRAVICEKDSIIQFNISSWGAAGFGYSISSARDMICDSLYLCYGDTPNRQAYGALWRYENSNNTIQIESTQALDIPTSEVIYYQKMTVKTWRVTSYTQDGHTFSSTMQAPEITAPGEAISAFAPATFTRMELRAASGTGGGFDPGSPGGDIYVPGKSIDSGAPSRGPESKQTFGSISDIQEDDRNTTVLGAVVFYFFVFKDHASANKVINVLNSPNPNAIG